MEQLLSPFHSTLAEPRPPTPTPTSTEAPLTPSPLTASPFTIAPVTPTPPAEATPTSVVVLPTPSPSPLPPFEVTVSDTMLELVEGDNASVTCSSNRPATFTWTSGSGLPSNVIVEFPGPQESRLLIIDAQQQNSGLYFCNATSDELETATATVVGRCLHILCEFC